MQANLAVVFQPVFAKPKDFGFSLILQTQQIKKLHAKGPSKYLARDNRGRPSFTPPETGMYFGDHQLRIMDVKYTLAACVYRIGSYALPAKTSCGVINTVFSIPTNLH